MAFEQYLQELAEEETAVNYARLMELSALNESELQALRQWWPPIPVERRRKVLERLVTMAEEDMEPDFNAVFRHCLQDEDAEVREKAVSGLWESEDRTLIGVLLALITQDPAERVRASAAISLSKFSKLSALGKLLPRDGHQILERLMAVVEDAGETLEVRRRALEAAAVFNTKEVRELIQWAYNNKESKLRISAVYAMSMTCDPVWLPTILSELSSSDPAMRYEAANASAELGEDEAIPYVIPLLQDDDLQVQLSAIRTLGALGGRLAKRALRGCLDSPDDVVIQEAAKEAMDQLEAEEDPLLVKSQLEDY